MALIRADFRWSTPAECGFRMPFEGDPHEATWVAWPYRADLWDDRLEAVQREYKGVIDAISRFEPVRIIAHPGTLSSEGLGSVAEMPLDDSWIRDNGPTVLTDGSRGRAAICWRFNAWGAKHRPWDSDALAGKRLAEDLDLSIWQAPITTEGGAVHSDGDGTLLVTETSLFNPNRNPGLTKDDATRILETRQVQSRRWAAGGRSGRERMAM